MNVDFNIIWYEDTGGWYNSTEREIREFLTSKNFEAHIQRYKKAGEELKNISHCDCDLFLIDYSLQRGLKGDDIIKIIRENSIFSDIIFYSADYDEMTDEVLKRKDLLSILDGVFFTDRDEHMFNERLEAVINKLIKKSMDTANIRGIVLDNSSQLDYKMNNIIKLALDRFQPDEIKSLDKKAKGYLAAFGKSVSNQISCFSNSQTTTRDLAVDDKTFLFDSSKKARIVHNIIKTIDDNYKKLKHKADFTNFYETFKNDIIKYRNPLGHANIEKGKQVVIIVDGSPVVLDEQKCGEIRNKIIVFSKYLDYLFGLIKKIS